MRREIKVTLRRHKSALYDGYKVEQLENSTSVYAGAERVFVGDYVTQEQAELLPRTYHLVVR